MYMYMYIQCMNHCTIHMKHSLLLVSVRGSMKLRHFLYNHIIMTDRQTVISFIVVVVASKEVLSLFFLDVQFYVAESSLELLARHMIFLGLITEPLEQLGLQGESWNSLHTKFTLLHEALHCPNTSCTVGVFCTCKCT